MIFKCAAREWAKPGFADCMQFYNLIEYRRT